MIRWFDSFGLFGGFGGYCPKSRRECHWITKTPRFLIRPSVNNVPDNLLHVGVSKNRGFPPKSSILIGFSIINHPFWGTPILGNTHVDVNWALLFLQNLHLCAKLVKKVGGEIHSRKISVKFIFATEGVKKSKKNNSYMRYSQVGISQVFLKNEEPQHLEDPFVFPIFLTWGWIWGIYVSGE